MVFVRVSVLHRLSGRFLRWALKSVFFGNPPGGTGMFWRPLSAAAATRCRRAGAEGVHRVYRGVYTGVQTYRGPVFGCSLAFFCSFWLFSGFSAPISIRYSGCRGRGPRGQRGSVDKRAPQSPTKLRADSGVKKSRPSPIRRSGVRERIPNPLTGVGLGRLFFTPESRDYV